jgi:hypothetical protein
MSTNELAEMETGPPEHVRKELAEPEQVSAVFEKLELGAEAERTTMVPEVTATEDHPLNERLQAFLR